MRTADECEVLVANRGVDAVMIEREDRRPLLVLNPCASFGAAVRAIRAVSPNMSKDDARALVRKYLPDAIDLESMMPVAESAMPRPELTLTQAARTVAVPITLVFALLTAGFYMVHAPTRASRRDFDDYLRQRAQHTVEVVADMAEDAEGASAHRAKAPRAQVKQTDQNGGPSLAAPDGAHGSLPGAGGPAPAPAPGVAHGSLAGPEPEPAKDPEPLPEPLKPCPRSVLDTLAVADLSDGPTSSASISKTVRFSPSRVSYDLALSLPCTITRIPRCKDSAAFSAACRQIEQLRNSVSPSRHSLLVLSKVRGVDATVKLATAAPAGVKRSSGSAVKLPTTVMGVSPATGAPSVGGDVVGTVSGAVGGLLGD